jgi:hypothetical protein
MRHARTAAAALAFSALLLAGCETLSQKSRPYATPPGNPTQDSVQTLRGQPQARVMVREGPVINSDTALSPEEQARRDAGQYCASVNLEARVLDLRKQRRPLRASEARAARGPATEWERVQLTFACERGQP